jgi:hypothetical protein
VCRREPPTPKRFVSGHGFSRAESLENQPGLLAPEQTPAGPSLYDKGPHKRYPSDTCFKHKGQSNPGHVQEGKMSIVSEEAVRTSQEVVQENRDYTLFSWSVQSAANPMQLVKGQGVWFWDGDGNRWLDFSSQLINLNLGHQHPKMLTAIKKQVDEL